MTGEKKLNLTNLRKIASKNSTKKIYNTLLENRTILGCVNHVIEISIHLKSVLLSYKQINEMNQNVFSFDFLTKSDILTYYNFIKASILLISLEKTRSQNEAALHPVIKLANLGSKILTQRKRTARNFSRKSKLKTQVINQVEVFEETFDNISFKN